jgi:hypothetical protein
VVSKKSGKNQESSSTARPVRVSESVTIETLKRFSEVSETLK